jgi:hypothetical protein
MLWKASGRGMTKDDFSNDERDQGLPLAKYQNYKKMVKFALKRHESP